MRNYNMNRLAKEPHIGLNVIIEFFTANQMVEFSILVRGSDDYKRVKMKSTGHYTHCV